MARTRVDVWQATKAEGDWPVVLQGYERAVGLLRQLDRPRGTPTNRLSWQFLAAIHGRARTSGAPDTSNRLWNTCQHGSWYFLPWHRMYLLAFEAIIAHTLGDESWSLPYWYSLDPDDASTSVLPPAFRDTAADNNLFTTERSRIANDGQRLPPLSGSVIDALHAGVYATTDGVSTFGGGERSRPSFSGDETGLLEDTPHGAVHVLVGNDYDADGNPVRQGWMGSFYTAALDPIFWLHHANLDRLWQVWLDSDAEHMNPPPGDRAWSNTKFTFPSPTGGTVSWRVGEVLSLPALGYEYESLAQPKRKRRTRPSPEGRTASVEIGGGAAAHARPEVIGAASGVSLAGPAGVDVALTDPVRRTASVPATPGPGRRVFLRLEGLRGSAAAPVYEVHLNLPDDEGADAHPELSAGHISTFGLTEATQRNDLHSGAGLTKVLDVTPVYETLTEQGRWDPTKLTVSFRPVVPAGRSRTGTPAMHPDLTASRVVVITT